MKNIKNCITGTTIIVLVILGCALILRLYHLNQYDLWFDELVSDTYSSKYLTTISDLSGVSKSSLMLDQMGNDPHSSLYFLSVYLYSLVFGDGQSLRLLSVLFSMLSLWIFYKLSRLFFNRRASVYALLIMAANPFHLWYAQEARGYAMACFFSLLMIYIYMKALKTGKRVYWACFPVAGVFAVYASYFSGLLLMTTGAALFFKNNRGFVKKWFLSLLIVFIFLWLSQSVLTSQWSFVKNDFWLAPPSKTHLLFTWKVFTLGYSATGIQYWIGIGLFYILFIEGAYFYFRTHKTDATLLLLFLFLPIVVIYLFSKFVMPVYINRQLLIFSPFYYLFIAKGLESIKNRRVQILAVMCVGGLMSAALVNYYQGLMFSGGNKIHFLGGVTPKKNYSGLMQYLSKEFKNEDIVAATDLHSYAIVRSYRIKHHEQYPFIPLKRIRFLFSPKDSDTYTKRFLRIDGLVKNIFPDDMEKLHGFAFYANGKKEIKKVQFDKTDVRRIWVVSSHWQGDVPAGDYSLLTENYLAGNFKRILSKEEDGIHIELYTRTTTRTRESSLDLTLDLGYVRAPHPTRW